MMIRRFVILFGFIALALAMYYDKDHDLLIFGFLSLIGLIMLFLYTFTKEGQK